MRTELKVNGEPVQAEIEPRVTLADLLRDVVGLTGTKVGCDTAQCGSCVVQFNGSSVRSCAVLAVQAAGSDVVTIEGLNEDGKLNELQAALREAHGTQCGFCTPGMVMSLVDLLRTNPNPGEQEIRSWLAGNLCRCTGYHSVVRAVLQLVAGSANPAEQEMAR
jgi:aerobic carbon-monoxide dehydrogenase small subunit